MHEEIFGQLSLEDMYIKQAFDHYRSCLISDVQKQQLAHSTKIIPEELLSHPYMGICDRTLGLKIPSSRTFDGGVIRGQFLHSGIFVSSKSELFRGCIVFPEQDEFGRFISAIGYRYGRVRKWQQAIIRWEKPLVGEYVNQGMQLVKEMSNAKAYH